MTRRKTFEDLGLDRNAYILAVAGTAVDRRDCGHQLPVTGCSACWVFGWLFGDRENPAHPYYRRDRHLSLIVKQEP